MSSNPLMMGYRGGNLLRTGAVWPTVGSLLRPVCAGCGQWLVWPAAPGPWRERIRGGLTAGLTAGLRRTRRCAIQIDSLHLFTFVSRWADESSVTFNAHIVPVIIQLVLKHVDWPWRDDITWQLVPRVNCPLTEEILNICRVDCGLDGFKLCPLKCLNYEPWTIYLKIQKMGSPCLGHSTTCCFS